ncbi:hypothetical protein FRC11_007543 [Ceratobasidium sp. 423]|nr:hypothetical protein FRC11_007543 [Ceratobasidium sp. 423]
MPKAPNKVIQPSFNRQRVPPSGMSTGRKEPKLVGYKNKSARAEGERSLTVGPTSGSHVPMQPSFNRQRMPSGGMSTGRKEPKLVVYKNKSASAKRRAGNTAKDA